MATKPRVHEIFSNQALDKSTNFRYEDQETREQIKLSSKGGGEKSKKGPAPQPPSGMKKFGGYKPKILGGQEDLLEVQNRAAILALSGESTSLVGDEGKSRSAPRPPPPQLTKPKPWVVGDKHVPMVVGGLARDDWSSQDDTDSGNSGSRSNIAAGSSGTASDNEVHDDNVIDRSDNYRDFTSDGENNARRSVSETSIVSETSTLVPSTSSGLGPQGLDNPALGSLDSLAFPDSNNNKNNSNYHSSIGSNILADSNDKNPDLDDIVALGHAFVNGSFTPDGDSHVNYPVDSEAHLYDDPVSCADTGVYIPEPDYDEDEKTLDFNSEDTSGEEDAGEDGIERELLYSNSTKHLNHQPRASFPIRQYEGEDLSHYLSDDEADALAPPMFDSPLPVGTNGKYKSKKSSSKKSKNDASIARPKLSQKHSLFKESDPGGTQGKGKRKGKSSNSKSAAQTPAFNSVRSFSYADSKYGTKGRATGREMMVSPMSHDRTISSGDDSDMFLNASTRGSSYESFLRGRHGQSMPTESSDSGVEMAEDGGGGVWKKLTWRLRNRGSKNYSLAEQ